MKNSMVRAQSKKGNRTMATIYYYITEKGNKAGHSEDIEETKRLANGAKIYSSDTEIKEPWEGLHEDLQRLDSEDLEAVTRQFLPKTDQRRYRVEWDKANTKQIKMKLNLNTDADILEKLESVPNKQGYIKELIRKDLEK